VVCVLELSTDCGDMGGDGPFAGGGVWGGRQWEVTGGLLLERIVGVQALSDSCIEMAPLVSAHAPTIAICCDGTQPL
jgi:hypothetical protein